MCYSYYCSGFDGYAYSGLGTNPRLNRMYVNLCALNSLFQRFWGTSQQNCSCSGGIFGCRQPYDNKLVDGDYLPSPGSNIPAQGSSSIGMMDITCPMPLTGSDDISGLPPLPDPAVLDAGILNPDLMSAGAMPPMANPMLSMLVGDQTLTDTSITNPLVLGAMLQQTARVNNSNNQAVQTQQTQQQNSKTPQNHTAEEYTQQANENITINAGDSKSVTFDSSGHVILGKAVVKRIKQIAKKINCDPQDLMGVIYKESGFHTVPKNWNGKSAVGLIQWTQVAIDDLNANCGTHVTKQSIAQMDVMQQLDLAEKTLIREKAVAGFSRNHRLTAGELYAMNFLPAGATSNVVSRRGDGNYENNSGLDINKDGLITQQELAERVNSGRSFIAMA